MNFKNNGSSPYSDETIEKGIREESTIYFKNFTYNNETVKQLINIFFVSAWTNSMYDNKTNNLHCSAGRSRSFTDLYSFILTHIPETDIKEVKFFVKEMLLACEIVADYCSDIKRSVFHYPGQNISTNHNHSYESSKNKLTEYNVTISKFLDNN